MLSNSKNKQLYRYKWITQIAIRNVQNIQHSEIRTHKWCYIMKMGREFQSQGGKGLKIY